MTNEKVIAQLKDMQSRCTNGYDAEAINNAIKALEGNSQGEWISKREAEKLGATCLARRNENGELEAIINLDRAPTVEHPTGEWYFSCEKGWECNKCHEVIKEMPTCMRKPLFNFCPNCGAYMRKEAEND